MIDHKLEQQPGWNAKAPTRRKVQLRTERTTHGHSNGNVANIVKLLKLVKVDHHFVPTRSGSENDLQITYSIKGYEKEQVKLRVWCGAHDPPIIFERDLTDEEKKDGRKKLLKWNGVPNCKSGLLESTLPSPVLGDLKISLQHKQVSTEDKITRVLYREIKFEPVSWKDIYLSVTGLASDEFADASTPEHQRFWIQYKLNELGYLAGPLSKSAGINSILRALFRYTLAHPNLPKIVDFQTRDITPGTCIWGWRQPWEAQYGTLDDLCSGGTTPAGIDLMTRLKANEKPRKDVVEEPKVFLDPNVKSRVIIDHDLYYIKKDFARNNANAEYDLEFLNRFCWPLKARVLLVAREDADATKPGVDSPEAVGVVEMDWMAFDPPEDLSCVPTEAKAQLPPNLKTRAREFIGETHKKLAGQFGDEFNALDNCPVSAGGWRPSDGGDMSGFFEKVESAPKDRTFIGCAPIQFKGSYIGGDNYTIQARIALAGYSNSDSVKQEHLKLKGLENAFDDPAPEKPPYPLNARTGTITNWRRHHILRELHWDSVNYQEINWYPVIDNFRAAHIILVPPTEAPVQIGKLLPAPDRQDIAHTFISDPGAPDNNKKEFQLRAGSEVFNPAAMYPLPYLPLKDWETAATLNEKGIPSNPVARFNNYATYFSAITYGWPTYTLVVPVARKLRESINSLNLGYGLLILRAGYFPEPDFSKLLPDDVFRASSAEQKLIKIDKSIAVGMDYGVVLLDRVGSEKYSETYYVTHEISHCLFGSHAKGTPTDHDKNDKNCMMYYNTENDGLAVGWGVKALPEKYTVRVLIEQDADRKEECGTLSGVWVRDDSAAISFPDAPNLKYRAFDFTGSIEAIRRIFADSIVTPANWFDKSKSFKILLGLAVVKTFPPSLSVKFPHVIKIPGNSRKLKPLESVSVNPIDLKAAEPRFCGKCLLKLRGWRVGTSGAAVTTPAEEVPEKSPATPVNGRMVFEGYHVAQGGITLNVKGVPTVVSFGMDARDPGNRKALMGPFQFLHKHTFYWESSTGNLKDLKMPTREVVKYQRATQAAPFNEFADPDQWFAQSGGAGSDGNGSDMHSMRLPSLICARNWGVPMGGSSLIATQSYQYCTKDRYSLDDADWVDIPNSHFRLEKSVYQMGKDWVMMFKKTNAPENPVPFNFEVHYRIGPPLSFEPDLQPNKFAGATQANPVKTYLGDAKYNVINQLVWAAGDRALAMKKEEGFSDTPTTIDELVKAGFAIRGSEPKK